MLAAAGDSGAWGEGKQLVQPIPGDRKGVLTVGGTTLSIDASGNYVGEVAWSATGGGYTKLKEPKYQLMSNVTDPFGTLAKPDVAADADPGSGVWFCNGGRDESIVPRLGWVHG